MTKLQELEIEYETEKNEKKILIICPQKNLNEIIRFALC